MSKAPGENTKKTQKPAASGGPSGPAKGAGASVPDKCLGQSCKTPVSRFGFCEEHYDQFKFGLIKKNGQMVSDYEKKSDHYRKFRDAQKKRGVA